MSIPSFTGASTEGEITVVSSDVLRSEVSAADEEPFDSGATKAPWFE